VVIYDHKHDYQEFFPNAKIVSGGDLGLSGRPELILVQPRPPTTNALEEVCRQLNRRYVSAMLIVEESDLYARSWPSRTPPEFYTVFHLGRERNVGSICITRRVQRLNQDLLTQAEHVVAFHTHWPSDLDYLSEWVGPEIYNIADNRVPYSYVHYQDRVGEAEWRAPVRF
jgi:hypothetical protein